MNKLDFIKIKCFSSEKATTGELKQNKTAPSETKGRYIFKMHIQDMICFLKL